MPQIKIGDCVQFTAEWLQSFGLSADMQGSLLRGPVVKVRQFLPQRSVVYFDVNGKTIKALDCNLERSG